MAVPAVFEENIQARQNRLVQRLETALGRALAPADVETLIANAFAYEIHLQAIAGNEAFRKSMVNYATGSALEELGFLVGVTRLPSSGAQCTIRLILVEGHLAIQIPQIRVQSIDGNVIFLTDTPKDVPEGVDVVDITATAQLVGTAGNNYESGKISIILDPQPYLVSAENITTTAGGINEESDQELRERIKLAPASFSVAGPSGAYKYWAKTAHPSIVDVAVVTTNPGEITLYPLCVGGTLPSTEILDAVLAKCDDEKIRPQNDTVLSDEPTIVNYSINVQLTTYTGASSTDIQGLVTQALQSFVNDRSERLGLDVIRSQISALCMVKDQVYNHFLVSPASDIIADQKTFPKCTGITVTITGSNDG